MVRLWACLILAGLFQALLAGAATTIPQATPSGTTPSPCVDNNATDCWSRPDTDCFGIYEAWARAHCPLRCGFCGTPPCEDVINYCAQFDHSTCFLPEYAVWARQNCRKTCNLCHEVTPRPGVTFGFEWESSSILPDNFTVAVCPGQNVNLLWNYTKTSDEQVVNVEWRFRARGASAADVIATEVNGHFFLEPGNNLNVNYVPNAGIKLVGVTSGDSGTYSVHVNINHQGSMTTNVQSVNVDVTEASISTNFSAALMGARYLATGDLFSSTHEHHLLLSCGVFNPLWIPSINVVWTTPQHHELASSFVENDQFILAIPNPLESGVYTCRIDDSSPASVCISSDSPLARGATVTVDAVLGRLTLMESELKTTEKLVTQLQNENANQTIYEHNLQAQIQTLQTANHGNHEHALEANVQQLQSENVNQTILLHDLESQVQHLQTENTQQASSLSSLQNSVNDLRTENTNLFHKIEDAVGLRLVNGTHSDVHEGRVEVLINGVWGTVCDDGFDNDTNAAQVVCRQLGLPYTNATVYSSAHFGEGSGPIHLNDVQCQGTEKTLTDCDHPALSTNCNHGDDVGVSCPYPLRLVNGSNAHEGRLEIQIHGAWGTVCSDEFDNNAADVVCKQLRLPYGNGTVYDAAHFGEGSGPIHLDDVVCEGTEKSVMDCSRRTIDTHNCLHSQDVGVSCAYPLRLVNGTNPNEGRVEIQINGVWGTVCDDYIDQNNNGARVVCRQLGLPVANVTVYGSSTAHFGEGSGPVHLDDVKCRGTESTLTDCQHSAFDRANCKHNEDVGVSCA